jgi:hypothetical protein
VADFEQVSGRKGGDISQIKYNGPPVIRKGDEQSGIAGSAIDQAGLK